MSKFIWRNIPETWQVVKIGELLKLEYGKSLLSSKRDESGSVTVYGSGGVIGKHSQAIGDYPTIIIGRKGSVGSINLSQNKFWCIDTAFYTTNIVSEISIDYLYFLLTKLDLSRLSIVVGVPGINRDAILNSKIPLPPLAEQKQIVAILQEADALRRKKKEILEKSNRLASALFLEMFGDPIRNEKGWEVKLLKNILSENLQPGFAQNPKNGGSVGQIRTHNVSPKGKIDLTGLKFVSPSVKELKKYSLRKGDIVFNNTNSDEWVGKTALYELEEPYLFSNHMTRIRVNQLLASPNYISLYLSLLWSSGYSRTKAKQWVNQSGIEQSTLGNFKIPLPPLPLQNDFAKKVEAIEETTRQIESNLQKMEKLYDSLLQKAFTGDLWFDKLTMTKVS